ncbi:MAG: fibronectin type III domain-containing protein [Bacteroidota bacterium]|nr:fibronectin type III domain-containing protein [Bacteroidota bacterium]
MREKINISALTDSCPIEFYPKLFAASEGDMKGEIDLQWDPVTDARFYMIQLSVYSCNLNWVQFDIISRSSYTISGLRSGKRYCFRVCAVNKGGKGPWSEIICKIAP